VARMMAKQPRDRYQQPTEVVQALAPFVRVRGQAGPGPAPPQGQAEGGIGSTARAALRLPQLLRRLTSRQAAVAVSAVVLVLVLAFLSFLLLRPKAGPAKTFDQQINEVSKN
jgi:hypothetical protein